MGYKITNRRHQLSMTVHDLEEKSGVPASIICGIESGKSRTASIKNLLSICKAMNITIDQLFYGEV